jgi:ribosomal peptide maturation radical SAM protein 1
VDEVIPGFIDDCLNSIDWQKYNIIGFSNIFAQTLSSLLLAKRIKERHPGIAIVFGGANMDSEMGFEIIRAFDWVDYVVHGEAEESFPKLLGYVLAGQSFNTLPGVSIRRGAKVTPGFNESQMISDLNQSPIPDYSDFFREADKFGLGKQVRISLSFESSRGCWWGAKAHCTFCGLNGKTMSFRKKSPSRVYEEIYDIASQYRCLTLNAVDNIMDLDYFDTLLPRLAEANFDLTLFYEVKASMSRDQVRQLAAAGVVQIQPGIESFNTEILRLMRKGVTAIQNIQLLKWCLEFGIDPYWNILYGFPGESAEQYAELPDIFRLLYHLRPPVGVASVKFERFSPYHFEREKFKLTLRPLSFYEMIYPEHLVDFDKVAYYFEGDWQGRQADPEEYIKPTLKAFEEWSELWAQNKVFLDYERGPEFLTIYDNRPLRPGSSLAARKRNLNHLQSKVYLYCDEIRSFTSIQSMLSSIDGGRIDESKTRTLLDQFVNSGLMFRESDRYLSLAVRRSMRRSARSSGQV